MLVREAIERALRLLGALGAGDAPTAEEMADALTAFNALKASWMGTLIGGRMSAQAVAAGNPNVQAENGGEYPIPAGMAYRVTAPREPASGVRFGVVDVGLAFGTTPCTVDPAGRLINAASGPLTLGTSGLGGRWWYRGDTGGWIPEGDWTDPADAIEWPEALSAWFPYMLAMALAAEFNTDVRQDVVAADQLGRAVMARTYGPRGRNVLEQPLGSAWPQPPAAGANAISS